ncbi:two-component system sensor histidine kinase DesK [Saccharopolyspora dendranthemae]|uniref:Two-component system sensor histidine kinase DesK n=1 Tax=Saccharopolyspora dendranthemae TaxID=1181886 RepID=A0A561TZW1_9PSEU|nr:two-component system sensor histidine kinase DesK [Saccharopolyspora dendranthemae]
MHDAGSVNEDPTEFDPRRLARLRRYTWWSIVPMMPIYALFPAINLATVTYSAVEIVVLALVALVVAVDGTQLSTLLMRGFGHGPRYPVARGLVLASGLAAAGYAMSTNPFGILWVLPVSGLVSVHVALAAPRMRWPIQIVATVIIAAVAWAGGALGGPHPMIGMFFAFYAVLIVSLVSALTVGVVWFWDMVLALDRARSVSGELAIARERLRFAADLHDVQGHHLQAIALKAELAERLVGNDDEAARAQAAEVAELARTALRDTRAVVQGYRHSTLTGELANAREILEAAGVQTEVRGDAALVPPPLQPLFGALVREGTTNVLRHSRARHCTLEIAVEGPSTRVVLRNDAANPPGGEGGSGIEGLKRRFATVSGHVEARHEGEHFELTGTAEEPGNR